MFLRQWGVGRRPEPAKACEEQLRFREGRWVSGSIWLPDGGTASLGMIQLAVAELRHVSKVKLPSTYLGFFDDILASSDQNMKDPRFQTFHDLLDDAQTHSKILTRYLRNNARLDVINRGGIVPLKVSDVIQKADGKKTFGFLTRKLKSISFVDADQFAIDLTQVPEDRRIAVLEASAPAIEAISYSELLRILSVFSDDDEEKLAAYHVLKPYVCTPIHIYTLSQTLHLFEGLGSKVVNEAFKDDESVSLGRDELHGVWRMSQPDLRQSLGTWSALFSYDFKINPSEAITFFGITEATNTEDTLNAAYVYEEIANSADLRSFGRQILATRTTPESIAQIQDFMVKRGIDQENLAAAERRARIESVFSANNDPTRILENLSQLATRLDTFSVADLQEILADIPMNIKLGK